MKGGDPGTPDQSFEIQVLQSCKSPLNVSIVGFGGRGVLCSLNKLITSNFNNTYTGEGGNDTDYLNDGQSWFDDDDVTSGTANFYDTYDSSGE